MANITYEVVSKVIDNLKDKETVIATSSEKVGIVYDELKNVATKLNNTDNFVKSLNESIGKKASYAELQRLDDRVTVNEHQISLRALQSDHLTLLNSVTKLQEKIQYKVEISDFEKHIYNNEDPHPNWIPTFANISYNRALKGDRIWDGTTPIGNAKTQSTSPNGTAGSLPGNRIVQKSIHEIRMMDNSISTRTIIDSNVTTPKIANLNVTTEKLANSAVTTIKIADLNVTTGKLENSAVTTAKIADNNVTEVKLCRTNGSQAVTAATIRDNAVITRTIKDSNVTTAKIADNHVTAAKLRKISGEEAVITTTIRDLNVTSPKLANGAITTIYSNQTNNSVSSSKLSNSCVSTIHINDSAVTTDKIRNLSVTGGGNTGKIAYHTVTNYNLADSCVDNRCIANGVDGSKLTGNIAASLIKGLLSGATINASNINNLDDAISRSSTGITDSYIGNDGYIKFGNGLKIKWGIGRAMGGAYSSRNLDLSDTFSDIYAFVCSPDTKYFEVSHSGNTYDGTYTYISTVNLNPSTRQVYLITKGMGGSAGDDADITFNYIAIGK